jgi:hypothetical protein
MSLPYSGPSCNIIDQRIQLVWFKRFRSDDLVELFQREQALVQILLFKHALDVLTGIHITVFSLRAVIESVQGGDITQQASLYSPNV